MRIAVFVLCICLLLPTSCSKPQTPPPKKVIKEENFLLIGLIPEENIFRQLDRYDPLAEYLSEKIGTRIKLIIIPVFGNIVKNFDSAGMDGAFLESLTYALAHTKLGVEVLARPENLQGVSTYRGLIFVRKDSGIKTVRDMKGKTFAFVDKASAVGYLHPLVFFRERGVRNYRHYLKEIYYTGTYEDSIYDVLNRKADIGAAKNTVFERLAGKNPRIKEELRILTQSPDFPESGLVVRKNLDPSIKKMLKDALLGMDSDPAGKIVLKNFGAKRFIKTTDEDYLPIYKYTRELNLNLATYDFGNE
jgi:phosphonate transport system substrate-binding protein